MTEPKVLEVIDESGTVVLTVNVDGRSDRAIERIMLGLLRNMREGCYINDERAFT